MMDCIKLIDDYISNLSKLDTSEIDEKINEFYDIKCNNYNDYKNVDIDIDKIIKNIIILELIDLNKEDFDKAIRVLKNKDFNYLCDIYKSFDAPRYLNYTQVVFCEDGAYYETNFGDEAFEYFGIKDLYKKDKFDENRKIILSHIEALDKEICKKLFPENFLNDVFSFNSEEIKRITLRINCCLWGWYNICNLDLDVKELQERYPFYNNNKNLKSLIKRFSIFGIIKDTIQKQNKAIYDLNEKKRAKEKERKNEVRRLQKNKVYLSSLKNDLSYLEKINFNLLSKVDKNIHIYIFEELFAYQKDKYKTANNDYLKAKKISDDNKLHDLLLSFGIDYCKFSEDQRKLLLESKNLDQLHQNMKILNINSEDNINFEIIYFLLNTSSKNVKKLGHYVKSKIISKKFLLERLNCLSSDSFQKNLAIIKNNKLSFNSDNYDEAILLMDNATLSNNNRLLDYYNRKKDDNNFLYLFNQYCFDLLDFLIEKELYMNLLDDVFLSNKDIDDFMMRFVICDSLNIPIYTDDYDINSAFLLGDNFYLDDACLDGYILHSKYEDEKINKYIKDNPRNVISPNINKIDEFARLEEFKSEDGTFYNIDEIIISRPKVMRNLTLFLNKNLLNKETILASIIYNSYLTDEQVELIKKCIYGKVKKHS